MSSSKTIFSTLQFGGERDHREGRPPAHSIPACHSWPSTGGVELFGEGRVNLRREGAGMGDEWQLAPLPLSCSKEGDLGSRRQQLHFLAGKELLSCPETAQPWGSITGGCSWLVRGAGGGPWGGT